MAYGLRTVGGGLLGAGKAAALGTGAVAAMGLRQAASAVPGGAAAVTMGLGGAAAGLGMIGRGAMKGFRGSGAGAGGAGAGGGAGAVGDGFKSLVAGQGDMINVLKAIKLDTGHIRNAIEDMRSLAYENARKQLKKIEKPKLAAAAPLLLTDQRKKDESKGFGIPWKTMAMLAGLGAVMAALGENLAWVSGVLLAKPWRVLTSIFGKGGLFSKLAIALGELKLPTLSGIKNWLGGTARYVGGFFSRIGIALGRLKFPTFQGIRTAVATLFAAEGPIATALSKIRIPKFTGIRNWLHGAGEGLRGMAGKGGFFGRIAEKLRLIKIPGSQGITNAFAKFGAFFAAEGPLMVALRNLKVPSFTSIRNWLGQGVLGRFVGFFGRIGGALNALAIPKFTALSSKIAAFFGETGPIATRFANISSRLPKIGAITPYLDDIARFFSAEGPLAATSRYLTTLIANALKAVPDLKDAGLKTARLVTPVMGFTKAAVDLAKTKATTIGRAASQSTFVRNAVNRARDLPRVVSNVARPVVSGTTAVARGMFGVARPVVNTAYKMSRGLLIGGVQFGAAALKYTGLMSLFKWLVRKAPIIGGGIVLTQSALILNDDTIPEEEKADRVGALIGEFLGSYAGISLGARAGAFGGAKVGAMLGTGVAPGLGTAAGGILGTIFGMALGGFGGYFAGQKIGPIAVRSAMGLEAYPGQAKHIKNMQSKITSLKEGLTNTRLKIESNISAAVTAGDQGEAGTALGRLVFGGGMREISERKRESRVGPANVPTSVMPTTLGLNIPGMEGMAEADLIASESAKIVGGDPARGNAAVVAQDFMLMETGANGVQGQQINIEKLDQSQNVVNGRSDPILSVTEGQARAMSNFSLKDVYMLGNSGELTY